MPSFSERLGITQPKVRLQVNSMDQDLRVGLWNAVQTWVIGYLESLERHDFGFIDAHSLKIHRRALRDTWYTFLVGMWKRLKLHVDTIDREDLAFNVRQLRSWYDNAEWNRVYDFVEWLASSFPDPAKGKQKAFVKECNEVLKREVAGFTFLMSKNELVRIPDEQEKETIESALKTTENKALASCHRHLAKATRLFSDRGSPDYANSIKESISAVESLVMTITKTGKTLGDAIKKVTFLHPAFASSVSSLYGYTSQTVRHGNAGPLTNVDGADAKFMLITASALVHLLVQKANDNGIKL